MTLSWCSHLPSDPLRPGFTVPRSPSTAHTCLILFLFRIILCTRRHIPTPLLGASPCPVEDAIIAARVLILVTGLRTCAWPSPEVARITVQNSTGIGIVSAFDYALESIHDPFACIQIVRFSCHEPWNRFGIHSHSS